MGLLCSGDIFKSTEFRLTTAHVDDLFCLCPGAAVDCSGGSHLTLAEIKSMVTPYSEKATAMNHIWVEVVMRARGVGGTDGDLWKSVLLWLLAPYLSGAAWGIARLGSADVLDVRHDMIEAVLGQMEKIQSDEADVWQSLTAAARRSARRAADGNRLELPAAEPSFYGEAAVGADAGPAMRMPCGTQSERRVSLKNLEKIQGERFGAAVYRSGGVVNFRQVWLAGVERRKGEQRKARYDAAKRQLSLDFENEEG